MERDRESIGLTPASQVIMAEIESLGWFTDAQDVARFSLGYAVRAAVSEGSMTGTETRWAAGNFDKSGEIRSLLTALYPSCDTPVRLMEYLVNEGLRMLSERSKGDDFSPSMIMDEI